MAGLSTGAPIVKVYHEKSMILPDVSRVLACLYEKDVKFETHTASYKSLLRLQASTHAPVPFYDGPTFLEESREICRYVAETYEHHGYPFLLGKDALERASIEQWLHHEEHAFNPPSRSLFCHLAFPLDDEDEDDEIDLQKRKLEEVLEVYEQRLSDSEFLAGNKFTLADLVHLPNSHYITASDKFVYLYDSRKNVQRWWNAISTRDSWQKVLGDIKKVEQQSQLEELQKQQQQWQREHSANTGGQIRLDPQKNISTKPQTILVPHPVGTISTSPTTPQAGKPYPPETFPDETPVPSSLSTPHKPSAVQSKETTSFATHQETLPASVESTPNIPEKSPIPFTTAASPTTAEKPPRTDADKSSIRDTQDSHKQAQTLPNGAKADGSTPKRQQAPVVPSTYDEKSTALAPPRGKVHDDHGTEETFKKDTVEDQKEVPPLLGQEPTSQVPRATEKLQEPEQMQAPTLDAHPTSAPTERAIPDARDTGDQGFVNTSDDQRSKASKARHDSAIAHVSATDQTKTPQTIFRQQATPPAPITMEVPDTQHDTRKLQEVTLDNLATDSAIPLVPSQQQVSHAPPTVPGEKDMTPAPGTRDSPTSETQLASAKGQETAPDYRTDDLTMPFVSSEKQSLHVGSATEPHEGPSRGAYGAVVDKETTKPPSRQAEALEASPDSTPTHGYVRPTSGDEPANLPDQGAQSPAAAQATYFEAPRDSASTQDVPADALGNFKKFGPHSTDQEAIAPTPGQASDLDSQPDSAPGEVAHSTKKFALSDQDSVHSAQPPTPAVPRKEETIVAAAEQTKALPTLIGQQDTQDMREAPTSDTQHASRTIQEVAPDDHHIDESVGHEKTTPPTSLTRISDAALDSTPTRGDVHPTSGTEWGEEPTSTAQAPPPLETFDSVPTKDMPADTSGKAQSMRPPTSPDSQRGGPGEVALAEQKFAPSDQDSAHSAQPLFSAAPDQAKDSQTTTGKQDISPAPETSKSPSSDTHHASGELQEVARDDHRIDESISSQGQVYHAERASEPHEGPNRDVHSAMTDEKTRRPPSSQAQSSDSKPESTPIHSDEPSTSLVPDKVAQQYEETQAPPPLMDLHDSISTQDLPPADALGKAMLLKPPSIDQEPNASRVASGLTPGTQHGSGPGNVAPAEQKLDLKDQDSSHSGQKSSSSEPTKEQTTVAAPDQAKVSQTFFGRQDVSPALTKTVDPSSDAQHASGRLQEVTPDDHRIDGPIPSQEQDPLVGYASDEKSTALAPPRGKVRDDHGTEEAFKKDTVDDRKEVPPLLDQEPTSQVQRATEKLQEAAHDGDTIEQWRHASVPLQDVTPSSGDDVLDVSTVDQKATPTSQQAIPSARAAIETVKRSVEQRVEPPAPIEAQTSDVQRTSPSFRGLGTAGRTGEPEQMQAPTLDAHPTSAPTERAIPDARDTGDQGFVNTSDDQRSKASKARHDSAIAHEDVHDASLSTDGATVDDKTAISHASEAQGSDTRSDSTPTPVNVRPTSGDELVRRSLRDQEAQLSESAQLKQPLQAQRVSASTQDVPSDASGKTEFAKPTSIDQEGMEPTAVPGSTLNPQLAGTLRDEAAHAEQKFVPSDQESVSDAQPLSSVESRKEDTNVSATDQTKTPQTIFRQQATPPAPITTEVPDTQHVTRKLQEVTLDNLATDSAIPLVPSQQQVSHAPPTIPGQEDMTPAPGTRDSPTSETQLASAKGQETTPDYRTDELTMPFVSSEKQSLHVGSATEPHEGPSRGAYGAVVDKETTQPPSRQADALEASPDSTPTHGYVRPTSGDKPANLPDQGAQSPAAAQATYFEAPRDSASTQDVPADALGNFKKFGPHSTDQEAIAPTPGQASDLDFQPYSAPGEVAHSTKKFALSDSVHSAQPPTPAVPRKEETIVAAAEQTKALPTFIGQQDTQDMREAPTSDTQHASRTIQEVAPDDHHIDESVGHEKTTPPTSLTRISDAALDSTPTRGDVHPTSGTEWGEEPTSAAQAPPPLETFDSVPTKDMPADTSGKAQSMRPPTSPDSQCGGPGEVALAVQKFAPSDQDSAHSAQPLFPAAPDQAKDSQTTTGKQDISPAPETSKSPSSDTHLYSEKPASAGSSKEETNVAAADQSKGEQTIFDHQVIAPAPGTSETSGQVLQVSPGDHRSGPTPDARGAVVDKKTTPPLISQAHNLQAGPDSTPAYGDVHPSSGDEPATGLLREQETQPPPASQASLPPESLHDSISTQKVSANAFGKVELLKATEPLSTGELRKEESIVAEVEQSKVSQPIIGMQDIRLVPGISEHAPDDDLSKESVSSQEQVFHDQRASEPHEGSPPDVQGAFVDKKTTPSSQAQSSDAKCDPPPTHVDVDPSITKSSPPLEAPHYSESTQDVPKSFKPPFVDQEAMSPTVVPASGPDTQLGTAQDDAAPDEQNISLSDQDLARSARLPFSAEPTKEDTIVGASDQTNVPQTVIGQQGTTPVTDKEKTSFSESDTQHASRTIQKTAPDDDHIDESVLNQEQVSLGGHASEPREGTTTDSDGTIANDKTTMSPSTQAKSSDAGSDLMAPTLIPAPAPDAPQGTSPGEATPAEQKLSPLDLTHSAQLPPSIESSKQVSNVAKADQPHVSQASTGPDAIPSAGGLREPTSSDTTHPSEKIQESTPDAYLTESVKPPLPMTGTGPFQLQHESSFDLSSDEKTTTTQGDQTNSLPNVSLSANQTVDQSESSAGKGVHSEEIVSSNSQKNFKGTSTEEKSKQQQKINQSSTQSSKDENIEANGTVSSNILTTSGDIQPSPPKERMEATEESRKQQADQAVFQSTQDNKRQVEETEAQDTGTDEPEETNLHENTNLKNNGTSQGEALDQPGKQTSGVQLLSKNTNNGSEPTKDASSGIQTDNKHENSLRTSGESKQQILTEVKTHGGETEQPASKPENPKEIDLPANSSRSINSQSQAEASDKSKEQSLNKNKNTSKLHGSTNDTKSGDIEDNPSL